MEFEFDKEIDSLLRQAAREGELAFNNSQSQIPNSQFHLDADEISAFAENALPKKARLNAVNHLADCTRCRKILADVIAFNAEEASEIIHAQKEPKTIIAAPKIPWYRQLFAFSNLTYTMGALVLLFGGLMTYVVYQSAKQDQNSSVAQVEKFNERPQNAKGASSDGETTPSVTYSNANSSSNSTVNSNSRMANALNTVPSKEPVTASPTVSNSAVSAPPPILDRGKGEAGKDAPNDSVTTDNKAKSADSEATKTEDKTENKKTDSDETTKAETTQEEKRTSKQVQDLPVNGRQTNILAPDSSNGQRSMPSPAGAATVNEKSDAPGDARMKAGNAPKKSSELAKESRRDLKDRETNLRNVNGKNFRRANNIWTDTAYKGESTKNISRGSDKYKKLDSGLRSIAENLGGTVIVVWKDKAYKIQ